MATTTNIHCDFSAGDDVSGDGALGNPYKTFQKAHDVIKDGADPPPNHVETGADTTIWLKGTAPYEESVRIEEETTATVADPLIVEGYTDTPGDGGMATLDGTDTLDDGISLAGSGDNNVYYWVFKNVRFTHYTEKGVEGVAAAGFFDNVAFIHCRFDNSVIGVEGAAHYRFLDCWFHDNSTIGVEGIWLSNTHLSRCIFEDNGIGVRLQKPKSGGLWNCLFIGNTVVNIVNNHGVPIVNCVIDGKNKASAIGVRYPDATGAIPRIFNTIILDCVVGVQGVVAGAEELSAIYNCCFWLNTDDFTQGAAKRTGCIFVDPQFIDRDNKDYGIQSTSPCKEAGLDLESFDYYTSTASKVDIGFLQEARAASGGLGIGAPQGFSVER